MPSLSSPPRILGAVLAGGKARRFGSDKAHAVLEGRRLIDHAAAALLVHCDTLAICGREEAGYLCLPDRPAPGFGPLGGLAAALHHARTHGYAGALTTGCDMPRFPASLASALMGDTPAILAGQPLAGYWPATLADALDRHLVDTADRSIFTWARACEARVIEATGVVLPNVNTKDDLELLSTATLREGVPL